MKRILALVALCLCVSIPSFGAEHILTHSAKTVGHKTYTATKDVSKDVAHATVSTVKFVF